jgi:hypothetical protein
MLPFLGWLQPVRARERPPRRRNFGICNRGNYRSGISIVLDVTALVVYEGIIFAKKKFLYTTTAAHLSVYAHRLPQSQIRLQ